MSYQMPLSGKRVWVAGHRGMVGSAIVRRLAGEDCELLTVDRSMVDLRRQSEVERWMNNASPEIVILAAAKVGGINANNKFPVEFLYDNLMIETNVISAAAATGVTKLLFLGSSCIYPKFAPQPIPESALLSGPLEPTNQWYAIAKIAGIKLCEAYRLQHGHDFVSVMPTNLYGPGDNFDLQSSHVVPALMRRVHEAKLNKKPFVKIWGSGTPRREFLHVDDCADACIHVLKHCSFTEHLNIGSGEDVTIRELVNIISQIVGYQGLIELDRSMPDGTPRKLLLGDRIRSTGWSPRIDLRSGIARTYEWYLNQQARMSA